MLHVVPDCRPREIQQFDQEDILDSSEDERPQFDPLWKQNQSLQKEKKLFPVTEDKTDIPVFQLGNNMSFEGEKKVRSTAKGKVTRLLNRIEPLLSSKGEDALIKSQAGVNFLYFCAEKIVVRLGIFQKYQD